MSYVTTFTDVGRSKYCGAVNTDNMPTYEDLISRVGRRLAPSAINFICDPDATRAFIDGLEDSLEGKVVAGGFRPIGKFTIDRVDDTKKPETDEVKEKDPDEERR